MHQTNPYDFLNELINITDELLTLRLRTSDYGKTESDVDKSCQMHYENFWMPYIVLNFYELILFFKKNKKIKKIIYNDEYHLLSRNNLRYLPKDLFFKKTGTAETSLMIEFSEKNYCFKIFHKLFKKQEYLF